MESIPFIISNSLIIYGYYSAFQKGSTYANNIKYIYDTGKYIYRIFNPKKETWEILENIQIIDPGTAKVYILKDNEDYTIIQNIS